MQLYIETFNGFRQQPNKHRQHFYAQVQRKNQNGISFCLNSRDVAAGERVLGRCASSLCTIDYGSFF